MGSWKNLVNTAKEASEDMEKGDKVFAFVLVVGTTLTGCCVTGLIWRMLGGS